ncbi:MAG: DUF5615 family PIN-like protein [Candidatus Omnitrophica bacterium]|nr:DUF5615 family PIN-like protein [Candidatus Omnitrophota bacterium]
MKFLIDADCPRSISALLKDLGHTSLDIRDINPATPDDAIYDLIKKDSLVLITRDTDFSNILRYPVGPGYGIILLRVHLLSIDEILTLMGHLLEKVSTDDFLGSLTVVRKDRIRIHKF